MPTQIARKPAVNPAADAAGEKWAKERAQATHSLTEVITFVVLFAGFTLFVKALEGIDGDTTFLALFCTVLSMFVLKSVFFALSPDSRRDEDG